MTVELDVTQAISKAVAARHYFGTQYGGIERIGSLPIADVNHAVIER